MALTISKPGHSDLIIKKSRFIGMVSPVRNRREATETVARLKAEHPDAAHVCWALLAGGDSAAVDDGEPGGTAGKPMLEVLRHQHLEGVLATTVRYFGGIKLGAGGLVRAYTDAIVQALSTTDIIERIVWVQTSLTIPYAFEGTARRALAAHDARILHAEHGAAVELLIELPDTSRANFQQMVNDLCHGHATWVD